MTEVSAYFGLLKLVHPNHRRYQGNTYKYLQREPHTKIQHALEVLTIFMVLIIIVSCICFSSLLYFSKCDGGTLQINITSLVLMNYFKFISISNTLCCLDQFMVKICSVATANTCISIFVLFDDCLRFFRKFVFPSMQIFVPPKVKFLANICLLKLLP